MTSDAQDFYDWAKRGVAAGWISAPYCATHDGPPLVGDEVDDDAWESDDPCIPAVRILRTETVLDEAPESA